MSVDAGDAFERLLHGGGVRLELLDLGTEDADDDGRARAREDFLDALAQVGEQVALESRVAVHDGLDLGDGRVVVDRRIEADPQLGEVRADDLVGHFGAADVRAEVPDAGNRHQLVAGPFRDARARLDRRARLLDPVHQEVVLAEVRQQLLAEERNRRQRAHEQRDEHGA